MCLTNLKVEMEGTTGKISFDRGRRMDFALDILQLKPTGLDKVMCKALRIVTVLLGNRIVNE